MQFSKLYAFPVGANGDALLADYLNDPSAAPPGMKPLFNTPEHLLPAGWGVCAPSLLQTDARLSSQLQCPVFTVPWMGKRVKPGILFRLGDGFHLPILQACPFSVVKKTRSGIGSKQYISYVGKTEAVCSLKHERTKVQVCTADFVFSGCQHRCQSSGVLRQEYLPQAYCRRARTNTVNLKSSGEADDQTKCRVPNKWSSCIFDIWVAFY